MLPFSILKPIVKNKNKSNVCKVHSFQEILRDMEDPQEMGYISADRFYPIMTKIMLQQKLICVQGWGVYLYGEEGSISYNFHLVRIIFLKVVDDACCVPQPNSLNVVTH